MTARMKKTRSVRLRAFTAADRTLIEHWAETIDSSNFMTRFQPLPDQHLIWDIVQVDGQDAGVVWLEHADTSCEARLGIMLGIPTLLGCGIGTEAILLIMEKAKAQASLQSIVLNVRASNTRAIACYQRCGFEIQTRYMRKHGEQAYAVLGMKKRLR